MLKTDDLDEYQTITTLINYCDNKSDLECAGCMIDIICDCMYKRLRNIKIEYNAKEVKDDVSMVD